MGMTHLAVPQRHTGQFHPGQSAGLARLFMAVAEQHGSRVAVSHAGADLTYAELSTQAHRVARALLIRGAGRGAIVAIRTERSAGMIVAMLGVSLAGAAYLPLDLRYPEARIAETIADATPMALLVARADPAPAEPGCPVLFLEDLLAETEFSAELPEVFPDDPAYVIYTSGSTGRPKGVLVSHGNVARLITATQPWFGFNQHDVWTMFHSFAFDFSVWEIWGCLLHGGRLVLVPYAVSRSPEEFHALLLREGVTVLNQTPSAFALLDRADAAAGSAALKLRLVIFGGEALQPALLRHWFERHGDHTPRLVNMYGITETTVHVTYRPMSIGDVHEPESLLGQPIPDLQLHLLDELQQPVLDGEEGELCIGGAGVALGYLQRPALNAERYIPDRFTDPHGATGARLYRSGDMARRRADGELVFLGRRDGQVKINGFRIELAEVEAALLAEPSIAQACVVAGPGPDGEARLTAYLIAHAGAAIAVSTVSRALAQRLPAHMLPSLYQLRESLPLNGNGKIDRTALGATPLASPAPARQHGTTAAERVTAIWQQVLGVEEIAAGDNFFDVGGTSVLLLKVRAALAAEFGQPVSVPTMFACTTVQTLAAQLDTPPAGIKPTQTMGHNAGEQQRQAFARARALRSNGR